uniref:Uncharacterized protein n=1 Tax=Alexandrium andersonii TaxID=327968 RepID=A0A7S2BL40_9DINO
MVRSCLALPLSGVLATLLCGCDQSSGPSTSGSGGSDIAVCPGEGDRYIDHKCNHDPTHRVCAQLLDSQGQPLKWGPKGDFWKITGQEEFKWDADIRANHGDSWCICMWATANMITEVGCDNVHLRCDSTDLKWVLKSYSDGGVDLAPAKKCLQKKCPSAAASLLQEADDSNATSRPSSLLHRGGGRRSVSALTIA